MAQKIKPKEPAPWTLVDRHAFDHLSKEERFLLFVVPAFGTARAAQCFILDTAKAEAVWWEFSESPLPVNLH